MLDVVANHYKCTINYGDQASIEYCRIAEFSPDLDTENPEVVEQLLEWERFTIDEYDIDGLRVDTVKHIRKGFWE